MDAYYNEFDPYAAEWLRNLMSVGLIPQGIVDERDIRTVQADDVRGFATQHYFAGAIQSGQVLLGNIAFDQEVHGMLGTEPKPFQATCSSWSFATGRYAHDRACEQYQALVFLRTTHTQSERSGSIVGIAKGCYLEVVLPWFWPGKSEHARGYEYAILALFSQPLPGGIPASIAIFDSALGRWGTISHNYGNRGVLFLVVVHHGNVIHIFENKKALAYPAASEFGRESPQNIVGN